MENAKSKKLHLTYHAIACAMRKNCYKTDSKTEALAKATKEYLLEVLDEILQKFKNSMNSYD